MRFGRLRRYEEFSATVVAAIDDYARELNDSRLDDAITAIAALPPQEVELREGEPLETLVIGWLSTRAGYHLSARALRKVNPGYAIKIRRLARAELGIRGRLLRLGFRVSAVGDHTLPEFRLVVSRGNELAPLPGSNPDARFELARVDATHPVRIDSAATPPVGFVDSVRSAPLVSDSEKSGWLRSLANRHPAAMHEFVLSPQGMPYARLVATAVSPIKTNARWADKLAISAFGLDTNISSDLVLLEVVRPNPSTVNPPAGLERPTFSVEGETLLASAGDATLPMPSTEWLSLDGVEIQDGGTVTRGSQLIVYEAAADPVLDFVSGQWETVFGTPLQPSAALLDRRAESGRVVEEGILMSGRNDFNWFHWFIEYLPRVLMADGVVDPSVPVILTNRVPPTGIQALELLSTREHLVLDPTMSTSVKRLHVVAPPTQLYDSTRIPWGEGLSFNPEPLLSMRSAFGLTERTAAGDRRVFLARRSRHRGVTNERELAQIASRHGLEVIDPSGLSFAGQFELFSQARLVVGASGAVMANYALMREGSSIIALTSAQLHDFLLPAAIAQVSGARFAYVTGAAVLRGDETRDQLLHADFTIDPKVFERSLLAELRRLDS